MKYLFVFLIILLSINYFPAQTTKAEKYEKVAPIETVRIDRTKPVVYIDFVKIGEEQPIRISDSKERVYLKLVNNSKWSIYVGSFVYGKEEKTGLYYEVERQSTYFQNEFDDSEIPKGYQRGHVGSPDDLLKPGSSINFSVPKNHLAENLKIRVSFDFEWNHTWMTGFYTEPYPLPEMSVVFLSSTLEKILEQKKKAK